MESEPSDPSFKKTFQATLEYIGERKWNDSWNELENLAPEFRELPQAIILRLLILNNLGKWEESTILGKGALQKYPEVGSFTS